MTQAAKEKRIRQIPAFVCMATTETIEEVIVGLKANGCRVEYEKKAGILKAWDGETRVYMAIQKGKGGPWIVSGYESDRIKWN